MSQDLARLAHRVGADLTLHAPVDLDGVPVAATLSPPDAEGLSRAVTAISSAGLAAIPRGGGCHLGLGNPPARADLFLSTARLRGVERIEAADGVCRARAGTRLSELRAEVRSAGWELPLEGPDAATVGGTLAVAAVGPRSLGFGPVRDAVLGLDVVLGSGEATHCGGRVVKNVTGYDLAKLYTGSFGSLGVISAAWLRLRPIPESTTSLRLQPASLELACEVAQRAARRISVRACALHACGSRVEVLVELAGDSSAVAMDAEAIGGESSPDGERLAGIAARQWEGDGDLRRYRIAALPSELPEVVRRLHGFGVEVIAYPGLSLVFACFAAADDDRALEAVAAAAPPGAGRVRCESAPPSMKRRGDVFAASPDESDLFRELKQRFDPRDALSPGRVVVLP